MSPGLWDKSNDLSVYVVDRLGSISAALSCLVCPFRGVVQAPFLNSGQ